MFFAMEPSEEAQLEELIRKAEALHCADDVNKLILDQKLTSIRADTKAVGKVIARHKQSKLVVRNGLMKAWSEICMWYMQEEAPNVFVFTFKSKEDKQWVMTERPWTVNGGHHWVLQDWTPGLQISQMSFNKTLF